MTIHDFMNKTFYSKFWNCMIIDYEYTKKIFNLFFKILILYNQAKIKRVRKVRKMEK